MDYVPFPAFSRANLHIWFVQMESAFTLNGIVEEQEKYDYLLVNVPSDSLKLVEDLILNPPSEEKYEHVKYELIKRMTIRRMIELEFESDLETPSEYLRALKDIAGQRVSNDEIKNVWLNNLPEKIREIVSLGTGNMDRLSEMADKAFALQSSTSESTSSTDPNSDEEISHDKKWCDKMKRRLVILAKNLRKHMCKVKNEDDDVENLLENILRV